MFSKELLKKLYNDIDIMSGSCRIRVHFIKIWRDWNSIEKAAEVIRDMNGVNIGLLDEILSKHKNLIIEAFNGGGGFNDISC